MGSILYDIVSAWTRKPLPSSEVAAKFFQTLDAIGQIDPAFSNWYSSDEYDGTNPYALATVRPRMAAWVSSNVTHGDYGPDERLGYSIFGVSGGEPRPEPISRRALFALTAGSSYRNYNKFEIGSIVYPPDQALVTFPLFKAVLLSLISLWPAPWANAGCWIWGKDPPTLPGEAPFPIGYRMPWISYLSAERAANAVVPKGVDTESTPDGGLLMIATEARFDPTNTGHMHASRLIAEIMIKHAGNPSW